MFYDQNQVDDLLSCASCKQRYDMSSRRPLLVPCCWKTLCERCCSSLTASVCQLCGLGRQPVCVASLPVNDSLLGLLRLKPVDARRAELHKRVAEARHRLAATVARLEELEAHASERCVGYFQLIHDEVNKSADSLVSQVNEWRARILEQVAYVRARSLRRIEHLVGGGADGRLVHAEFKRECVDAIQQTHATRNCNGDDDDDEADEDRLHATIDRYMSLEQRLDEATRLAENVLDQQLLVFNQRQRALDLSGQLAFDGGGGGGGGGDSIETSQLVDHALTIRMLADKTQQHDQQRQRVAFRCARFDEDGGLLSRSLHIAPIVFTRFVSVRKSDVNNYDEFADITIDIVDIEDDDDDDAAAVDHQV